MNFAESVYDALGRLRSEGLFIRLRQALPNPYLMLRAFRTAKGSDIEMTPDQKVVVVGIGAAAVACLRELRKEGFSNVTVVAKDDLFGGKCVNIGCMPIELTLSRDLSAAANTRSAVQELAAQLRADVKREFEEFGFPLIRDSVTKVEGNQLHLSLGDTLEFDRLILALGNTVPTPRILASQPNVISIDEFWTIPAGSRIGIYAEANIMATTLGEAAMHLGLEASVLLAGRNPLASLPSYRYFLRELVKRGVEVFDQVRLEWVKDGQIGFSAGSKPHTLECDYVLIASKPIPRFIEIDGKNPSVFDIDLVRASIPSRPDIFFVGDGGGLLTASEAEIQAKLLMRHWKNGDAVDLTVIGNMPVSIHARQTLAMVGPEWSYLEKSWNEVDFRSIGWSKVYGLEGKLWYLLDKKTEKVTAVHICHQHASELICIASALMAFPVGDVRWMSGFVHPSSAEIFKVVSDRASATLAANHRLGVPSSSNSVSEFVLPPIERFDWDNLPDWLNDELWHKVLLAREPIVWLSILFGLRKLEELFGATLGRELIEQPGGNFAIRGNGGLAITHLPESRSCQLAYSGHVLTVRYG